MMVTIPRILVLDWNEMSHDPQRDVFAGRQVATSTATV